MGRSTNSSLCPEKTVKSLGAFLIDYVNEVFDLVCGVFSAGNPRCKALVIPPKDPNIEAKKSPIIPLVELISTII